MTWWRRWRRDDSPAETFADLVAGIAGGSGFAYQELAEHLGGKALGQHDDGAEMGWLGEQDPTVWRRLDAVARDPDSYPNIYPQEGALRTALTADCSSLLAVVASFHPSGYVRERGVEILGGRLEPATTKALAVRCADWVEVVREKSQSAVLSRADRQSALAIVPFLVAMVDQDRSRGLLQQYLARISPETVGDLARFGTRATRRLLVDRVDLADDDLARRAIEDEDPLVRRRSASILLARRPAAAAELLDLRLGGVVIGLAVEAAPEGMVIERADRLLLDRRVAVRGSAQRRLTRLGVDVSNRYRELVDAPDPPPWAIVGLGETGGRRAGARIMQLAQHPHERVRRGAILAAHWALTDSELVGLAGTALHDESELVVHAATRVLRRRASRIPRHVVLDAIASQSRTTQIAGLRLARRSDRWTRLEVDLLLAAGADAALAREGRADLATWRASGLHGTPAPEQRDAILRLLDRAGVSASTQRWIRFCCGAGQ